MVCVAAFIILCLIGVFVAFLSIFKPEIGKRYWKIFQKSWSCISKKIRLQKCETGFKDDVKNTILSKIILRHPKWVKPLNLIIELLSVLIVLITIWSLITALKSLLALWTLGTCNITKPATCSFNSSICSIDEAEPKNLFESASRWFSEWGEIFVTIPDKFQSYRPEQFNFTTISLSDNQQPIALDILDPGCLICITSYKNQLNSNFTQQYHLQVVPIAIQDSNHHYKFKNSEIMVRYLLALATFRSHLAPQLLNHIFTDYDQDILIQTQMNLHYSREEAINHLDQWLKNYLTETELINFKTLLFSDTITKQMEHNLSVATQQLHLKGIPMLIYDGKKHPGIFPAKK